MENDAIVTLSPLKQVALSIHAELTAVFKQHPGGWADTDALQSVQRLCLPLERSGLGVLAEKAASVARLAGILYSDRKHARWGVTGPERIHSFIRQDLVSL
jgi:hypothetical protein